MDAEDIEGGACTTMLLYAAASGEAATVELLNDHFGEHGEKSRVMVFTTFRSAVGELMKWLASVGGVRAQRFIGQSAGKGEFEKGMAQKEQRQVARGAHDGSHQPPDAPACVPSTCSPALPPAMDALAGGQGLP